ncbi:MAG: helix-turn-helix transcriptional regulator [Lysobacter sp.]|nr:helix-turn-helix transcriptional regulator [Lysobacter sp.]
MARRTALWRTDDIHVHRFDHAPCEVDHGPVDEVGQQFSASFVEKGGFDLVIDGRDWRLGPGDLLLVHPGMRFRVVHGEEGLNDVCLTVGYVAAEIDGFDRERTWARARMPVLRANHRLRYLHWGMRRALDTNAALLAETCASELFREIPLTRVESARSYKARTLDGYAQRIHAARDAIDRRYGQDLRLGELAHSVGMSTFHFARLFAELVGMPPHRYLLDVRLRAASVMLRDGRSVTDTCFACGFNNLSHFSRIFAHRYGASPSLYPARSS